MKMTMKMTMKSIKRSIAQILRKVADLLAPTSGIYLPPLSCRSIDVKIIRVGYQYPKGTTYLNYDQIRYRLAQQLSKFLIDNKYILFVINDGDPYVNTIEASIYVKRPENIDNYKEI